jgi:2-polyprenyl-6-methoxyphenol hydroxylase-like FAD-dependent oxidoreductase
VTGIRGHHRSGASTVERARVVVGADGRNSVVAGTVHPPRYEDRPPLTVGYYSYWSNLPTDTFEAYSRPGRGWAVCPTNDDLTLVIGGWPHAELARHRDSVEAELAATFALSPAFAERIRDAKREERIAGTSVPNYFRTPYGPGWALAGDAGYCRDFITAQGITDAFLDAEHLATALDAALAGTTPYDEAMASYQSARDTRAMPVYQMTLQIAALQPPDEQMIQLLSAMPGNQDAMDAFARLNSGVTSPPDFFAPENVARIATHAGP